ncbi:MAG TPA: tetratricopeptide repeat protein [Gemmatimonadota bacterium]
MPRRRLAAIWFADIVGFTGLSARDERSAMALVSVFQQCARSVVGRCGGRLVKFLGDGAMADFDSAEAAVRSALELRSDFESLASRRAVPALLRIGIHAGDVISAEGDIYGDGVNVTSRIQREALPGQVLVSEEIWRQIRGRGEYTAEDLGERQLRGLEGTHHLYGIHGRSRDEDESREEPTLQEPWAIAVLPFVDISPGQDNEYFSDGMTEELIHSLGRIDGLRVASRTSSYSFKGRAAGIAEIAEALHVNVVLEGSVRKSGSRVRVTPLLIDTANGYQLWTDSYEREMEDVFDLQETISDAIVDALQVKLGAPDRITREHTQDTSAYDEYLKGRYHWNRHSPDDLRESIEHYERAITSDPDYALAWAGLADTYITMGGVFLARPGEVYPRAREAAEKAIALDPRLAPAQAALAEVQLRYDWDWEGAERGFKRALALDPDYADARSRYANLLREMGRFDEAIVEVRRAQRKDPLSLPIAAAAAGILYHAGRYDEAIEESRRALERAPQFYNASYYLGVSHLMKGNPEEAVRHFEHVNRLAAVPGTIAGLIVAYAAAERREEAATLLNELLPLAEQGKVPAYFVASAYVALDDRDEAFRWFDRAVDERTSWLTSLRVEPRFEGLHGDPRFRRLLVRVGLAPSDESVPHNLPAQQTSILGREREIEEIRKLLSNPGARLITLVGPGGVGKSRLAMECASRGLDAFPGGCWLVQLSAVEHSELLIAAIARVLEGGEPGTDPASTVASELRGRRALLVLDGFEHLLDAGPTLVDLLGRLPELRILVTSQATLRVRGERVYRVEPLTLPAQDEADLTLSRLSRYGAVALFLDRMEAVKPAHQPSPEELEAILEICRRLDGLPLAIELAAAWLTLMSPPALLGRLEDRFAFLVQGPRDLPARHQTLRAVCDWSYGLLDPREQATFRDLAPFAGGCSLDAAEWMERGRTEGSRGADPGEKREALDLLATLVDKSLLRQVETGEGEPRFQMLETVRQYGMGLLETLGEIASARRRQLDYFVSLVSQAEPFLTGPEQSTWLDRLERDHENIAAAIDWALEAGEVETAVRLGSAVWWFWWLRGHFAEMRKRLDLALEREKDLPRSLRANLHVAAGVMATLDGEHERAAKHYEEALALERSREDRRGIPRALRSFASGLANLGQFERARPLYEEALAMDRQFEDHAGESAALRGLGKMALLLDDLGRADELFEESLEVASGTADPAHVAYALAGRGDVARCQGRLEEATKLYRESLEHCRRIGSQPGVASALQSLALTAVESKRFDEAEGLFKDALRGARSLGDRRRLATSLIGLGVVSVTAGQVERGARLLGAGERMARSGPLAESTWRTRDTDRWLAWAGVSRGENAFERSWEEGRSLSLDQALTLALSDA